MILCGENLFDKNQHKFGIFILPRTKKTKKSLDFKSRLTFGCITRQETRALQQMVQNLTKLQFD
jgi:hypothetical protein